LPHAPVALALVEHPEGAGHDAVAAAVADVLLDDDGPELGPEYRAGRADVEASRLGAVLADVGAHQPAEAVGIGMRLEPLLDKALSGGLLDPRVRGRLLDADRHPLLDEGDVPPAVGAQLHAVVVGGAGEPVRLVGHLVPL